MEAAARIGRSRGLLPFIASLVAVAVLALSSAVPAWAASSPTGRWVTFTTDTSGRYCQTSEYYIASESSSDGGVEVRVRTTFWDTRGTANCKWSTTKTFYDNGRQCGYIGPDWTTGPRIQQGTSFKVYGGGTHRITMTETDFRGTASTTRPGWDFTISVPYTITVSSGSHGSVSPSGRVLASEGSSLSVSATPDEGYHVSAISVDGSAVEPAGSYTLSNIRANHSIAVSFEINRYAVTFVDGVTGEVLGEQEVAHGSPAVAPEHAEHYGWHFTGWDADFNSVTGDMTVTSVCERNPYTASFYDGAVPSSFIASDTVLYTDPATAPDDPERYGYDFAGWDADFSSVTENMTVTALWDAHEYSIAFDAAGGEGSMDPVRAVYGEPGELPACSFTREGYAFQGWAFEGEDAVSFVDGGSFASLTGDDGATVTLRAVWDEDAPVKMTYSTTDPDHSTVSVESEEVPPATGEAHGSVVEVAEGYRLVGWVDASGETVSTNASFVPGRDGSLWEPGSYTAVIEPISYSVSFDAAGGEGSMDPMAMSYDAPAALPACSFTRPGYTFQGWAAEDGGGVAYADREVVSNLASSDGDVVALHAVWAEDPDVTIVYGPSDPDSGEVSIQSETVAPVSGTARGSVAEAAAGYTFQGWLDGDGDLVTDDDHIVPERGDDGLWRVAAYTAAMDPVTYTIAFDANGGEGSMDPIEATYDEFSVLPACAFTRQGYTFAGWSTSPDGHAEHADRDQVANLASEDGAVVTLYAVWDMIPSAGGASSAAGAVSGIAGAIYDKTGFDPVMAALAAAAAVSAAGALAVLGLAQRRGSES